MIYTKAFLPALVSISILALVPPSKAQSDDQGWFEGDTYEDEQWVDNGQGPSTEPEVDENYFFDQLSPYGDWIWTPEYGWVWRPAGVSADWRPYTYGQWTYTDYGWTWSSYYPWGWAAFHYGRWAWIEQMGWVWVPGQVWAPAWVMWRYSGAYVGWSPLLAGYDPWYGWAYYPVFYSYWTFIDWDHFCDPYPNHHFIPRHKAKYAFRHTYFPRRCRDAGSGVCVRGPSHQIVQKVTRRKIVVRHLENTAPRNLRKLERMRPGNIKLGLSGNTLRVFRPRNLSAKGRQLNSLGGSSSKRAVDLGIIPNRSSRHVKLKSSPKPQTNSRFGAPVVSPNTKPGATIEPTRPAPSPYGTSAPYGTTNRPVHHTMPAMHKSPPTPSPSSHRTPPSMNRPTMKRPVQRNTSPKPAGFKPAKSSTKTYKPSRSSSSRSRSTFHPSRSSSRSSSGSSHRSFHRSSSGRRKR